MHQNNLHRHIITSSHFCLKPPERSHMSPDNPSSLAKLSLMIRLMILHLEVLSI